MRTNGNTGQNGNSTAAGGVDAEATRARTDALYRQHARAVARICRALLRDRAEAEDATQQVFLSAHRALLSGMVPYEPGAWLATIARRECWARVGAQTTTLPPGAGDGASPDIATDALRRAELTVMWTALAELPSMQRDAFLLREIRGLSYGQVGQQLARSEPSVRSLLGRARRRLRLRLQDAHTALGGVPWLEPVARLVAGGSNPAAPAVRAAAIGLGAAAIAGGAVVTPTVLEHHVLPPAAHAAARPARVHAARPAAPRAAAVVPRRIAVFHHVVQRRPVRRASHGDGQTEHARAEIQRRSEHEGGSADEPAGSVPVTAERDSGSGGHGGETTTSHEGSDGSLTAIAASSMSVDGGGVSGGGGSGESSGSGESGGSGDSGDSGHSGGD